MTENNMNDNIHMMEQGSELWHQYKCGKISASHISDVMAKGKGTTRKNYLARMVAERMSNTPIETFSSGAMLWGIETEPLARKAYSFKKSVEVLEVGFIDHPEIEGYGVSPDGLVGETGMVEFKCPNTATHIETLLAAKARKAVKQIVGDKYYKQMQGQMDTAERDYVDYVSFDPRMPIELRMVIVRVVRDDIFINQINEEVLLFIEDMINMVAELDEMTDKQIPAETAPIIVEIPALELEELIHDEEVIAPEAMEPQEEGLQEVPDLEAPPEPMLNLF